MNYHPELLRVQISAHTSQLRRQAQTDRELRKASQPAPRVATSTQVLPKPLEPTPQC